MAYCRIDWKENQTTPQSLLVCLWWCLLARLQHTEAVAENSVLGLNLVPFQSNLLHFLGKDQNVFHTFVHNKFPLRGSPVKPLFRSLWHLMLTSVFSICPSEKGFT